MSEFTFVDPGQFETLNGLGLVMEAGAMNGMGKIPVKLRPGGVGNPVGTTGAQRRVKDVIWHTAWSKIALGTAIDTPFNLFSGTLTYPETGNVQDGTLPAPQAFLVKEVSMYANGIADIGLLNLDFCKILNGILKIWVADKLMLDCPAWRIGVNAFIVNGGAPITPFGGNPNSGPMLKYALQIPIMIPQQSKFSATFTTAHVALTGACVLSVALTGELQRLVS